MKPTRPLLALCVLTLPLFVAADDPPARPQRDLARENADLRAYVDRLEERVRQLQDEVRELKRLQSAQPELRIIPAPPQPAPRPPVLPPPPRFDDMPIVPWGSRIDPRDAERRNWQERRFNGGTYYIIPLTPQDLVKAMPQRP